MIKTIFAI